MSFQQLVCYYDSRTRWLDHSRLPELTPSAIRELAYLIPRDEEVLATFQEVAEFLSHHRISCQLVEANDNKALAKLCARAAVCSIFWNMTDGFYPVTASYFPAFAAMKGVRYFGNSSALQLSIQNKFMQYIICKHFDIPTPRTRLYDGDRCLNGDLYHSSTCRFFVKPFDLANSIGVFADSTCSTLDRSIELARRIKHHYQTKALIQDEIVGRSLRVNYVAVDREKPIHENIGIHWMQGPPEEGSDFKGFEDHLENFMTADAEYAEKAVAHDITVDNPKYQSAVAGIRTDTEKLVRCLGLRDFFSMDYKLTDSGERYFIELNTLPFARNRGLKAYCWETFGLSVGRALGAAILASASSGTSREW